MTAMYPTDASMYLMTLCSYVAMTLCPRGDDWRCASFRRDCKVVIYRLKYPVPEDGCNDTCTIRRAVI